MRLEGHQKYSLVKGQGERKLSNLEEEDYKEDYILKEYS